MALKLSRLASKVHKWLALIIGAQIILWFVSGWFMSFVPIEKIRSEHRIRQQPLAMFQPAGIAAMLGTLPGSASRIEVRMLLGRPVALVETGEERPILVDLATGSRLSPIPADMAMSIARADYAGLGRPVRAISVETESTQYRGPLPAWRVEFDDDADITIYVAADQARVTARRTDLWRVYDFLWGLHIMDWTQHRNINGWWLWGAAVLSLFVALSGIVMIPSRFGWNRKRPARLAKGGGSRS